MEIIPRLTDAGRLSLIEALSGSPLNFTKIKIGNGSAPDEPSDGDYWYDTDNEILYRFTVSWFETAQTISVQTTEPVSASKDDLWYNTNTHKLYTYGNGWKTSSATITCSSSAPASPSNGDYWYDTENDILKTYDETQETWETSQHAFSYGATAPASPTAGVWWFDSAHSVLKEYGLLFLEDSGDAFAYSATAPVKAYNDDLWYDTANSTLKTYLSAWSQSDVDFTYSSSAPASPSSGDWWYDTANSVLYEYNGTRWNVNSTNITCSSSVPATQNTLTDLINPLITIPITQFKKRSDHVELTCSFDNSNLTSGFNWVETGIFVEDSNGNDVLYAYCHSGEQYEYIPANDVGKTIEISLTIAAMIGDATEVSATIGEGTVYITREAFEEHRRDFTNPHGVSKEQIGLGNVENVSPGNMAIQYATASSLQEPASGEEMSTFLGKVKKAINALILHLSASNPHSITPEKIGASASNHSHAYFGYYSGNGNVKRFIPLQFTPSAVLLVDDNGRMYSDTNGVCGGLAVRTHGVGALLAGDAVEESWDNLYTALLIGTNGFWVNYNAENHIGTNTFGETYRFIAFR